MSEGIEPELMRQLAALLLQSFELKRSALKPLTPDAVSTLIPVQHLDVVSLPIEKHKQMPAQWILLYYASSPRA